MIEGEEPKQETESATVTYDWGRRTKTGDRIGYGHLWLREKNQNRRQNRLRSPMIEGEEPKQETESAKVTYEWGRRTKTGDRIG